MCTSSLCTSQPTPQTRPYCRSLARASMCTALRQIFEKYGEVEEVFIMRGGSRSGMACAFIRFQVIIATPSAHHDAPAETTSSPLPTKQRHDLARCCTVDATHGTGRYRCNTWEGVRTTTTPCLPTSPPFITPPCMPTHPALCTRAHVFAE